jgi:hypothetical protein
MTTEPTTQHDTQHEAQPDSDSDDTTRYTVTDLGRLALAAGDQLAEDGPPADDPYAAALWLVNRHRQLAELARRIPGVHGRDSQGPWLDLDLLADAINTYDDDQADEDTLTGAAACEFSRLSGSEQGRLRLLATLGWSSVRFRVGMLSAFDANGQALIGDWYTALRAS